MYPTIHDYTICGTEEVPRLMHRRRTRAYTLTSRAMANILHSMDGVHSMEAIARLHNVPESSLHIFTERLVQAGVVVWHREPLGTPVDVHVRLGPHEPWLQEVHIDITDRCNLADMCPHCYRGEKLNERAQQPARRWHTAIEQMAALGVQRVAFSGGEPFMRTDLPELVSHVLNAGMFVSGIFTNGTVHNTAQDQVIDLLVSRRLHSALYVSLDGPDAVTNDRYRGAGSFEKTMAFIRRVGMLRETHPNIDLTVNSQVSVHTVDRLEEWYDLLRTLHIKRWRMNAGRMTGRLAGSTGLRTDDDTVACAYAALIDRYIREYDEGRAPFALNVEGVFRSNTLQSRVALTYEPSLPICDYKTHALSIEPNGDVQFCTSWDQGLFGNVFEQGIGQVWYSDSLQRMKHMRLSEVSGCVSCDLLWLCGGGCRHVAPNVTEADPYACGRYRAFFRHIVPVMERHGISFRSS